MNITVTTEYGDDKGTFCQTGYFKKFTIIIVNNTKIIIMIDFISRG